MSFQVITDFENAVAEFYGAPFAVAVDSCTHSLELCLRYQKVDKITVPTRTYLSVAFLGDQIGINWDWKEDDWDDWEDGNDDSGVPENWSWTWKEIK